MEYIYGGGGDDIVFGHGDTDYIFGDAGDDILYGGDGPDDIYGGPGRDIMFGGSGYDDLFSGYKGSLGPAINPDRAGGGGDVMWLGENETDQEQRAFIYGTGDNPENFTVVMDFWLESAVHTNQICLGVDPK